MKFHVKATLLSALVLPGLGQLYKGEKTKGLILIILVNVFILAAIYLVIQYAAPLFVDAAMNGKFDANMVLERLHNGSPAVRALLAAFSGIWLYSLIDAALGNSGKQ